MTPHSGAIVGHTTRNAAMVGVKEFAGITSDSRKVKPGYLFAALTGSKTDGARFVKDAVARGAIAVLGAPAIADTVAAAGVRFIADENPRAGLAQFAAAYFAAQPETVAAVTGTKGKSSIVAFLREIWTALGKPAASLGTVGVVGPNGAVPLSHTTPDPVEIHELLARLKAEGVEHLAIEASSHGLDQHRLDGVVISACGFTNITRDHMDYHPTFEHYLQAKLRLFTEVVKVGGVAVVNADADHADRFIAAAKARGLPITCGVAAHHLTLNELDVGAYYTFRKVRPPLRSEADRAAMAEGVASGVIDVIVSSHEPQGADTKRQPFASAAAGTVGLETLLPAALTLLHDGRASLSQVLAALTATPARIFGLPAGRLAKGAPADLVLLDEDEPFVVDAEKLSSRARNTAFDGRKFSGRAQKTYVGGECVFERSR